MKEKKVFNSLNVVPALKKIDLQQKKSRPLLYFFHVVVAEG
jgi:hypothetical protein